jgi:hypothetical protein
MMACAAFALARAFELGAEVGFAWSGSGSEKRQKSRQDERHQQRRQHHLQAQGQRRVGARVRVHLQRARRADAVRGGAEREAAHLGRATRRASNRYLALTAPTSPVSTANTAASAGMPPSCAAMPIATGAVTDFGASEASTSRRQAERPADGHRAAAGRRAAGQRRDQQRPGAAAQFGTPLPQRPGQRDDGRAEQEVDELRAGEVGRVGRAGEREQRASASTVHSTGLAHGGWPSRA